MNIWEDRKAVEQYMREADVAIPDRREILYIISRLATDDAPESPMIADLGGGFGDLTAAILEHRPMANVELIDLSKEMMRLSRSRFKGDPRVRMEVHDLNLGLPDAWDDGSFDSIASCQVLHYIEPENRVRLYKDIWSKLKDGAMFINGDLFKCDSPAIDRWEFDDRIRWLMPRMRSDAGEGMTFEELKASRLEFRKRMGEKPGTVWQLNEDLRRAGFRHVDLLWKKQCFAILAAIK